VHRLWEQDDPDAFSPRTGADPGIATTTLFGKVRADLIERLPALEIIASFGVGTTTWTSPPPCKPARS
jgi:lactate dehydrogenase-like 2-hydroxyacid dehydrogenase